LQKSTAEKKAKKSPTQRRTPDRREVVRTEAQQSPKGMTEAQVVAKIKEMAGNSLPVVEKPAKEALLGKPLNHGRFFPAVTEIRTFDGEKVKTVQGLHSKNFFVTVKHCGHGENETFQRAEAANQMLRAEAKPVAVHPDLDLCVLHPPKTCAMAPDVPMRTAVPGERVYLLHRTPEGHVIHQGGDIIDGEQHTCPTPNEGGLSGAPIFAESDHKMVGMHFGAFNGTRKTNAYVPAEKIGAWVKALQEANAMPKN